MRNKYEQSFLKPLKIGKKGFEFSFTWIFAIIAGVAILLLAIYGAVKFSGVLRYQTDTEIAKEITILTDPLQAGFAEGSFAKIEFQKDTRINNNCYADEFGRNGISVSSRSRVGEEWLDAGAEVSVYNKYIFSSQEEGEEYYVFSKPFKLPYKIADLIFLSSKDYCFVDVPGFVEDEVGGLGVKNINVEGNCSDDSIIVCFGSGSNCDIFVYENYVEKDGEQLPYVGSLMYGAIFADKGVYRCNVERLLYRGKRIADVLTQKAELMNIRGTNTDLLPDLMLLSSIMGNATASDLIAINGFVEDIDRKNDREGLGLW